MTKLMMGNLLNILMEIVMVIIIVNLRYINRVVDLVCINIHVYIHCTKYHY